MNTNKQIMGIDYKPILNLESRVVCFLAAIDDMLLCPNITDGGKVGMNAIKSLARIYFDEEVQIINLRKQ